MAGTSLPLIRVVDGKSGILPDGCCNYGISRTGPSEALKLRLPRRPHRAPRIQAAQIEKLENLLKDQGVLTDEEFQKAKDKLLAPQK